jgi:hypothetical protein
MSFLEFNLDLLLRQSEPAEVLGGILYCVWTRLKLSVSPTDPRLFRRYHLHRSAGGGGVLVNPDREESVMASFGALQLQQLPLLHLGVHDDLGMFENRLAATIDMGEAPLPILQRRAGEQFPYFLNQPLLREWFALAVNPVRALNGGAEGPPEFFLEGAQRDKAAVGGAVDLVAGRPTGQQVAATGEGLPRAAGRGQRE